MEVTKKSKEINFPKNLFIKYIWLVKKFFTKKIIKESKYVLKLFKLQKNNDGIILTKSTKIKKKA